MAAVAVAAWAAQRPAPERLRSELGRILAQPEYQQASVPWLAELIRRFLEWWLRDWGPGWSALHEAWPVLYWAIVAILCVALVALLYHIVMTIGMAFTDRPRTRSKAQVMRFASPDELRHRALSLAADGRYGEAVRALYEALIRLLDLQGVLRYDSARTNWEYLEALGKAPALAAEIRPLTLRLDGVLYGGATADEAEFTACRELVDRAWASGEVAT
jgi:hypothetical protein